MAASSRASESLVNKTKRRLQGKLSEITEIKEGFFESVNTVFSKVDTLTRDALQEEAAGFLKKSEEAFRTLERVREAFFHVECQLVELESVIHECSEGGLPSELSYHLGVETTTKEVIEQTTRMATSNPIQSHTNPNRVAHQSIPELSVKEDAVYAVTMSANGSPSSFALVLDGNSVVDFLAELTDSYRNALPLASFPAEDSFVVCKYSGVFCRARFNRDCVILVDTGDLVTPVLENLFPLQPRFADVPAQALLCCLQGVVPAEGAQWSAKALIRFAELTKAGKLMAKFAKRPSDTIKNVWDARYAVELYVSHSGYRVTVNEDLVRLQLARKAEPQPKKLSLNPAASEFEPSIRLSTWSNHNVKIPMQYATVPVRQSSPQHPSAGFNVSVPEFVPGRSFEGSKHSPSVQADRGEKPPINAAQESHAKSISNSLSGSNSAKLGLPSSVCSASRPTVENSSSAASRVETVDGRCTQSPNSEAHREARSDKSRTVSRATPSPVEVASLSTKSCSEKTASSETSSVQPARTIKPRPFPKSDDDTVLKIIVTEIVSPSHFYVHIDDEVTCVLLDLEQRLAQFCPSLGSLCPSPDQVQVGSFWALFWKTDQVWVRAQVTAVKGFDAIDVTYIDFGCRDTVKVGELRPLLDDTYEIPSLAVRAKLDCVEPASGDEWIPESIETFRSLVGDPAESPKALSGVVLSSDEVNRVIGLGLLEKTAGGEIFINNALVDAGFAVVKVPEKLRPQSAADSVSRDADSDDEEEPGARGWNPMEQHFYSGLNAYDLDGENVDSLTKGYVPREKICRYFARNGRCFKGETCPLKHVRGDPAEATRDYEMVCASFPTPTFPRQGDIVYLQVSTITKQLLFYALFPHGVGDVRLPRAAEEDPENLETLHDALQAHYNRDPFADRLTTVPALGEVVIAKSSGDQKWYRGKVCDDVADGQYRVFFVDFGHNETVDGSNLRKPCDQFMHLPPQAYECILADYVPANPRGVWDETAVEEFRRLVEEKDLVAEIVDHEVTVLAVKLFNGDSNIGEALVSRGLAKYRKYQPCQGDLPG